MRTLTARPCPLRIPYTPSPLSLSGFLTISNSEIANACYCAPTNPNHPYIFQKVNSAASAPFTKLVFQSIICRIPNSAPIQTATLKKLKSELSEPSSELQNATYEKLNSAASAPYQNFKFRTFRT